MIRLVLSLAATLVLFFALPNSAAAHCGTCGVGGEAAADGDHTDDGHANCAFCQGDTTAECTCAHAGGDAEAADGDGHANCAF